MPGCESHEHAERDDLRDSPVENVTCLISEPYEGILQESLQ
jgi:hypothetical protein